MAIIISWHWQLFEISKCDKRLRMGAPLPTKSVLLIRAVQSIETSNLMTPELVTPTYCDEEKTPEVEEKKISANEEKSSRLPTVSEAAKAVAIIGTE